MKAPARHETILASPLEWGLGHTVRLVPFIETALADGHRVILASDGTSLDFLRHRFPLLEWVRLPFYPVRYAAGNQFFTRLFPQIPGIWGAIRSNHRQLSRLVKEYGITRVISDHRYGMWHSDVHSIFITNQLWLKAPRGFGFAEGFVYRIHRIALRNFSEILIADHAGEPNLSGLLTHPRRLPANAAYIGPVSRFMGIAAEKPADAAPFDVLAIVSGPEPQRTLLEELLTKRFSKSGESAVILRGLPPKDPSTEPYRRHDGNILFIDHARDEQLAWYIFHAREIICRPGNSTLSDLLYFGKTALLVPTPGQTEQEYVAGHLEKRGGFKLIRQKDL
jgi:UDP:flavonoid glycosyltransferase YjiC (YdhE family)